MSKLLLLNLKGKGQNAAKTKPELSNSSGLLSQWRHLTLVGPSGSGKVQHAYELATAMGVRHIQLEPAKRAIEHLSEPISGDIRNFESLNPFKLSHRPGQTSMLILKEVGYLTYMEQVMLYAFIRSNVCLDNPISAQNPSDLYIILTTTRRFFNGDTDTTVFQPLAKLIKSALVEIAPLHHAKHNIEELALQILIREAARLDKSFIKGIDADVLKALVAYDWPGNIRELENVIRVAVAIGRNSTLTRSDFSLFFKYQNYQQTANVGK